MNDRLAHAIATVLEAPLGSSRTHQRVPSEIEPRDAIVVLGAALLANGSPARPLRERIAVGAELFARGAAPMIIASGGVTRIDAPAEADVIADALVTAGVSRDAIVCERASLTTAENARRVAALPQIARGARIWLVTQPFHARRAIWLFTRAGLRATAWPMPDSIQFRHRRRATRWLVREYAAWACALACAS